MITSSVRQWADEKRYYPKAFDRALAPFLEGGPAAFPPGRHALDGDAIYLSVQRVRTEPAHLRRFELHRDYLDIQLVVEGAEAQEYWPFRPWAARAAPVLPPPAPLPPLLEDCLNTEDVAFYARPASAQRLLLEPGAYAVYLPGELHCPLCAPADQPGEILKVVFKIHKTRLP